MNCFKKILSLLIVAAVSLSLISCSTAEAPDKVVTNAFQALKTNDQQTLSKYFDVEELKNLGDQDAARVAASDQVFEAMFSKLETKVLSTSIDNDKALVKTELTNVDMQSVLGNYFIQAFASAFSNIGSEKTESELESEMSQQFLDLINNEKGTRKNTVDIHLVNVDKQWKIEVDESLQNAILGGFLSAINDLSDSFASEDIDSGTYEASVLFEIDDFLISDIWNDAFCNVPYYTSMGTDATGSKIDIDFMLEELDKDIVKLNEYNEQINEMTDLRVEADLQSIWSKLYPEILSLHQQLKENKPAASEADYEFDTGLFEQYRNAFSEAVYAFNGA